MKTQTQLKVKKCKKKRNIFIIRQHDTTTLATPTTNKSFKQRTLFTNVQRKNHYATDVTKRRNVERSDSRSKECEDLCWTWSNKLQRLSALSDKKHWPTLYFVDRVGSRDKLSSWDLSRRTGVNNYYIATETTNNSFRHKYCVH